MKASVLLITLLCAGTAGAGDYGKHGAGENKGAHEKKNWEKKHKGEQWQKPSFKAPVVVNEIGFQAVRTGGKVELSWKSYQRPDFKYYKVVRSNTNPDPVYPEDGAIKYFDDPAQTGYEDWAQPGTWYYRLCVLTQNGDRWVSPVVTVQGGQDAAPSAPPAAGDFK